MSSDTSMSVVLLIAGATSTTLGWFYRYRPQAVDRLWQRIGPKSQLRGMTRAIGRIGLKIGAILFVLGVIQLFVANN